MRLHKILITAFAAVVLAMPCRAANEPAPSHQTDAQLAGALHQQLLQYLRAHRTEDHVSAVSLTVSLRNRTDMNVSAGSMEYNRPLPVKSNSLWQIGSNTKAFTAATLLELEAEHKLSINDKLATWLPQYPSWGRITIERLLNMTSGIATYDDQPAFMRTYAAAPYTTTFTPERLVSYANGLPLKDGYRYTNTAYILAQMIIEKSSHDTYAHQITARFIAPLGLHDTYYAADRYSKAITARMPAGYLFEHTIRPFTPLLGKDVRNMTLSWAQGAGGIVASTADLTKWVRALYEGRELAAKQQAELTRVVSFRTGKRIVTNTIADPQGSVSACHRAPPRNTERFCNMRAGQWDTVCCISIFRNPARLSPSDSTAIRKKIALGR